ncbi:MAG: transcriptional regulator [Candidatus Bathyarchaeota archaeon]|nr:MAG: transcriptional regulator [Candidatus Bathyarchaeota archaeon]
MRRDNLDICVDILQVAKSEAKKTHMVYRANLNFKLVKGYLRRLVDNGFISTASRGWFTTTDKGDDFLKQYNRPRISLIQEKESRRAS